MCNTTESELAELKLRMLALEKELEIVKEDCSYLKDRVFQLETGEDPWE